jgi:hypothetical protein
MTDAQQPSVAQLEVTAAQASDALAMAKFQRKLTLAPGNLLEESSQDRGGGQGNRALQNGIADLGSVQIAALEITGPEHEVQSFLETLGLNTSNMRRTRMAARGEGFDKKVGAATSQAEKEQGSAEAIEALPAKPGEALAGRGGAGAAAKADRFAKRGDDNAGKDEKAISRAAFGKAGGAAPPQQQVTVRLIVVPDAPTAGSAAKTEP